MTWNYIAGFFDGEGSVVHNKKGFRITISQTNQEVLEKIKNFTEVGIIFKERKRKPHWKDSWIYYIAKQEDVYKFLVKVSKFLIVKKERVENIIPKLEIIVLKQRRKKVQTQKRTSKAKKLREKGLTYRQIGKKLNMDFGHARRLILKDGGSSSIG